MKSLTKACAALIMLTALGTLSASGQNVPGGDEEPLFDRGALHVGQQIGSLGPALAISGRFAHEKFFFMIQGRFIWKSVDIPTPSLESETHQDYSVMAGVLIADETWAFHAAAGPCFVRGSELGEYLHSRSYKKDAGWVVKLISLGTVRTVTVTEDIYAVNKYAELGGIARTGISLRLSNTLRLGVDIQALATKSHTDFSAGFTVGIGTL